MGCDRGLGADFDADGYAIEDGDCNDCDAASNPGAFDVSGNNVDEDCNGVADDEPAACDDGLPANGNALDAAKAIGICRTTSADAKGKGRTWGLISARYVFPDGTEASLAADAFMDCPAAQSAPNELSHGILDGFGPNVRARQGSSFALISSGVARAGRQVVPNGGGTSPEQGFMCTRSIAPKGFPVSSYATCGDLMEVAGLPAGDPTSAYDGMALEVVIRVPTNAKGFAFEFDFYTSEYTQFVCSPFNDAFAALLYSMSQDQPSDHSIAFDSQNNPICVNNGFVEVCDPFEYVGARNGMAFSRTFTCQYGTRELSGTGFDADGNRPAHAATGWLRTRANVVPAEDITLRFAIWDAGDEWRDSTVLLDNFTWEATPGETTTMRPK